MDRGGGMNRGWLGLGRRGRDSTWRRAVADYWHRAGGKGQAVAAVVVGGTVSMVTFRDLPYVPAALVGVAGSAYAVQLPKGNWAGETAREVGRETMALWDTCSRSWSQPPRSRRFGR
mmetsp:Transcript_96784/g.273486  ORF Transcript_96784/g.273486 Transcript_96784/m.273486 type:complete len:117 (+) Transcript_96784:262-612(+)